MRAFIGRHRAAAIIVAVAVALMAAALGYAWYAGAGSGSNANAAVAGSSPEAVTVTVDSNATPLYPGSSISVPVHIAVGAGGGSPQIGTVSFSVAPAASGCLASWFSIPSVVVNARAPQDVTGSLTFNDLNLDQSACSNSDLAVTATVGP